MKVKKADEVDISTSALNATRVAIKNENLPKSSTPRYFAIKKLVTMLKIALIAFRVKVPFILRNKTFKI